MVVVLLPSELVTEGAIGGNWVIRNSDLYEENKNSWYNIKVWGIEEKDTFIHIQPSLQIESIRTDKLHHQQKPRVKGTIEVLNSNDD